MLRIVLVGLAGLVIIVGIAIAAFLAYRAHRQHDAAQALDTIRGPRGINEAMFVRIGGVDQWVQIRGEDRDNPVILVVHGGMAMSYVPQTAVFQPWEKHFTVVQWERRGVGKTYGRKGAKGSGEMSLDRIAQDGIELADWLRTRLHKRRIILLGHSMGSQIGVTMAARAPDRFHAYVACEQIIDMASNEQASYRMILAGLRAHGEDEKAARLETFGPPPYPTALAWGRKQQMAESADPPYGRALKTLMSEALYSPAYSAGDFMAFVAANQFAAARLYPQWMAFDARKLGTRFGTPVVVIQGEHDMMAPTPLVRAWLAGIEAPHKEMVPIEGGHLAMFIHREAFLKDLVEHVRPLAAEDPEAAPPRS